MATSNKYKECQETHAICVVFEPMGEEGTPESFFCATCGVNRKFHRQEKAEQPIATAVRRPASVVQYPPTRPPPPPPPKRAQPPVLKFEKVILGDLKEEMKDIRKSRTIFTPLQKYHLREFSEKIGWTMRGQDNGEIDRFCDIVGISRPVLKNWLNNHKPRMEFRHSSFAPLCLEYNN